MLLQSREQRDPNLIFMSSKHPPLLPALRFSITPLNSGPKWSKNAKNQKIRYISVITKNRCKNFLGNSLNIPHMCYGQFATFRLTRACFVHVLHTIEVAHLVFLAPNRTFAGIFNYLPCFQQQNPPQTSISTPSYRYMRKKASKRILKGKQAMTQKQPSTD